MHFVVEVNHQISNVLPFYLVAKGVFSKEIDDCRPGILMTTMCGVKEAKEVWVLVLPQLLLPVSSVSLQLYWYSCCYAVSQISGTLLLLGFISSLN